MNKKRGEHPFNAWTYVSVSAYILWCFALPSCMLENNQRDIRGYYFPMEKLAGGEVYVYESVGNTGTDSVYWYHRSFLKGEQKIFSSTFYENYMVPLKQVQEEVVHNGLLLKDLYFYDLPDATKGYKQQRTEVKIVAGNCFPFVVKDRFGVFLYHIQWKTKDSDSTTYSVIKNRMFMGDTTFTLDKREIPAVFFKVKEKIEIENEGVSGQLFEGIEIYAKGIGLVYYGKKVSDETKIAYRYVRGTNMEELEKKWEKEKIIN